MISITFKYRYRKQILIAIIIFIALIGISTTMIINYEPNKKKATSTVIISKKEELEKNNTEEQDLLKVDIKGEVINPGIYTLSASSRVIDVIEKAGGLTENANTTVINLSKKITDEMVIIIYSNSAVEDFVKTKEKETLIQESCIQQNTNALVNGACITTATTTSSKISINNATLEQLQTLPGIGESKAKDILNYKEQNGPFKSIDELKNISGIGESIFAKIKDYITI